MVERWRYASNIVKRLNHNMAGLS